MYHKRIVFDIDDTISFTTNRDWVNAKPNQPIIDKINKLYNEGWEVFLHTARGSISAPENADSLKDFTNKQGVNGWEYGYYQGEMNPSSFKRFEYVKDWDLVARSTDNYHKSDFIWSLIEEPGYANFTQLWDLGGHPNHYSQGGSLEWAVRRWTSDIDQTVNITGEINDTNKGGGGDGITARIYKNGSEIYSKSANNSSPVDSYTYTIDNLELKKGDIIISALMRLNYQIY